MPATITGIVFNDLNHNGVFNPGEPGIPGVFVVLSSSSAGTCIPVQTDANGNYSFTVTVAGTYTVYEPVANPGSTCPPTTFTQPTGFTFSNGPRKLTVSVTTTQINNNVTIANNNFSHDTINNPLSCSTSLIQFAGTPTTWYNINVVTGNAAVQGLLNPPDNVNAIGYNVLDNYIYAYDQTTNNVVRVDNSGNLITLSPSPPGLPVDGYNVGAFDLNGFLYISVNTANRFYVIDLRPNSSTFMKLVNPATGYTEQTSNFGVGLSTTLNVSDWVYNPSTSFLYGINPTGFVQRISPTTGNITSLTTTPHNTGPFGAIAQDSTGNIYAISNPTGTIFKYTISGNTATAVPLSTTVTTSFNDATMCLLATINIDFGDAPDTSAGNGPNNYSTLLANNGPRHEIQNALFLGTQVTSENDAYQNPTATGDDISKGIQDDGLTVPLSTLSVSATGYVLHVTVTNNTGTPANLYGWIDFNRNGIFQGNEAAPAQVVPSLPGTQSIPLSFTVPSGVVLSPSQTFVRLRLTTDVLVNGNAATPTAEDTRSLGPASDGEVEDYILNVNQIADLMVVKTTSPIPLTAGNPIQYTIVVTNNGPDTANSVTLTDPIPPEIVGPVYSIDGGATFHPWTGSLALGTLPAGGSITVLIKATVSTSATGTTINTATVSSPTEDPDLSNNTSTSIAPINQSADVSVVKTASPSPATAGEPLTYTIVVANAGPDVADDVTLIDAVPSELTNPEFSTDGGVTFAPWPGTFLIGSLAIGASETILIRGTLSPSSSDSITNTAIATSTTPDPDPTNNTSTIITPVLESADLSVVKLDSPNSVLAGDLLTYTIVVSNAGPSDAQNATLTDAVPGALAGVEFSTDGGATFNPWTGSLGLGTLPAGSSVTVLITGTVVSSAVGAIVNTAIVSSTTPDPDPTNNTSTTTTPVIESADISVEKTGSPSPVPAGGTLTYTIVAANAGPSDALNVTLTDVVPGSIIGPEYSLDGGVTFNPWPGAISLGTLVNGAAETILLRGTVDPLFTGTITNTATVNSTTPDPDPTNNTSTEITPVNTSADLAVVKIGSPDPVLSGGVLTYSIVVSNAGPNTAQNVLLTDAVPAVLTGVEYSTDGGFTFNPWPGSLSLGTLNNGATETILLRGTVNPAATGLITNTAVVSSTTPDPDPTNNTSTETTGINASADVFIIKVDSPDPVIAGEQLTYTIVTTNAGPSEAENVTIADAVPSELSDVEFSTDGGATFNPWPGSINIGTLADGDSSTILIRGTVNSSVTTTITNTATASSTTPDPDLSNNTSTVDTEVDTSADVSIVKTASPDPAVPGQVLEYSLLVANAGPSDAVDVEVIDAAPSELVDVEYSTDGGVTFNPWPGSVNIGTLPSGDSATILLRGTVSSSVTDSITNSATVNSATPDPDPTNNTSTIVTPVAPSADVSIVKTSIPNPVTAGSLITYSLVVSNAGPSDAENVTLTDAVPGVISDVQFSLDGGVTFQPWPGSVNLGSLASGNAETILIRGIVDSSATGSITNTAVVSSTTLDPDPTNNTSTIVTPVVTSADVSVVKTASPSPVTPGNPLTFTIVIANAGPSDAQNVLLADAVPGTILSPEYSVDGGVTFNPWPGSLSLGTLLSGASETILIRGTVSPSAVGSITNTATVSSTTPDPDPTNNTSTVVVPVSESADVSVVKTALPSTVIPGDTLTYTIVVANEGPSAAQNVTLTDAVPASVLNPQYSVDGGITFNPWPGSLSLGTLADGTTETIIIRGTVAASATGDITNTAIVSSTTPDPDPTNNTSTAVTPINPSADVSIVKTADPVPVTPGETLTYTLLVANDGPSAADNVVVTDAVPAAVTGVVYSLDGGVSFNPWPGSIGLGTLASGDSVTILLQGTVSLSAAGAISNTATVASTTPDPNPTNNTSTIVTPINPLADISVVKTASPVPVAPGGTLTYTIVVSNAGPNDADQVTLTDAVPSELDNAEYSTDGGITFSPWPGAVSLGTLANGASTTVLIRGVVSQSATDSIVNTAVVSSTTTDPDPTNNTSTTVTPVSASADISVVKLDSPSPVLSGDLLTYTLIVSNAGPSDAANVTLADAVPASLLNVEYSTDGGSTFNPWPGSISLGTLANGSSETILIRGTVSSSATGNIVNTAVVSSTTPDPDPTNNTSTSTTPVITSADVSVVKTGSPSPVLAGNLLTYTIDIANAGPSDAQNVTLTDAIPAALLGTEYSVDGGVTFNPWTGSLSIGTLPSGGTETILIRGTVNPLATGTITNTAVVSSTTPDPDPTNNTSTEITPINTSADLSVDKTGSPNPVQPGDLLTYTIVVSNAGPNNALNVTLTDAVPGELTGVEYSTDGGVTFNPWPGSIGLGTLVTGASETILIQGTVIPSATGTITNTAVVDSTTPDPDPTNNTSTDHTGVNALADLQVIKIGAPNPVFAGDDLTYTIVAFNAGPSTAENVIITDIAPSELTNVLFSTDGGVTFNPWPGFINIGNLASGDSFTLLIRGTVLSSATGSISNTATVASITPDPDPTNNTSTADTDVDASADISIVKTASPDPANPGQLLTYTIVVSNAGPSDAQNVVVVDAVSSAIPDPQYSTDGGNTFNPWPGSVNLGTVASGASITLLIEGTISDSFTGDLSNTATAHSTTPDPDPTNNTSTIVTPVNPLADLSVVKTASPSPITPGTELTYSLVVSNAGPSDAENVTLSDAVPLQNVQYSTDGGVTFNPWPGAISLGTLASGSSETVLLTGSVASSVTASVTNTATVTSTTPDPDITNNTSTTTVPVSPSADVSIIKLADPNPVTPGQTLTYTLSVTNAGPSDAQNITVVDAVPAQLSNVQVSIDGGVIYHPWPGSISIPSLASGVTIEVLIRGTVNLSASGTISNTAIANSSTPDPNPTNNTSTIVTPVVPTADVSVVKTASATLVNVGDTLTYTIVVANAGPDDADNVALTDAVSSLLANVEYSTDGGATFAPWPGSLNLGTLASGTSFTVLIRGTVVLTDQRNIRNTATASSTTFDPNPANNSSTINTAINVVITITTEDAVNLLLSSIAVEELGIAHIINSEAEKIQYALGTLPGIQTPSSIDDLLSINSSVKQTLKTLNQLEMLLLNKLEDTLKIEED
ncbi:DUF6923 family protein [Paenibacillus sp. GCM10027627]|uniref:DUF7507 domain-containing protein n=1 Tax=unclassified Paenibacillus TaxID=185978 RepID=UPI00363BDB79